jgi:hypothetical protein
MTPTPQERVEKIISQYYLSTASEWPQLTDLIRIAIVEAVRDALLAREQEIDQALVYLCEAAAESDPEWQGYVQSAITALSREPRP